MPSLWSSQKESAVKAIAELLGDGNTHSIESVASHVEKMGVSRKNALKAIYAYAVDNGATLSGTFSNGSISKGGK